MVPTMSDVADLVEKEVIRLQREGTTHRKTWADTIMMYAQQHATCPRALGRFLLARHAERMIKTLPRSVSKRLS